MKKLLVLILVVIIGYIVYKNVTCPIPKFNEQELEFIQQEEGIK